MSISLMEHDMRLQCQYIDEFKAPDPLPHDELDTAIFTGSGDSLAAAMLAEAHSGLAAKAADPLDMAKNGFLLHGRRLFIVSISGRTISNIRVAAMTDTATAITARPQSDLGRICQSVIPLRYPSAGGVTAGTISFLASALHCISLVRAVEIPDPRQILDDARRQAKEADLQGRVFVLGNLQTYPLALYTTAKLYEVLGYGASCQRIEQFFHADLFSARGGDTVIVLESPIKNAKSPVEIAARAGLHVLHPQPPQNDTVSQFLFYTFFAQELSLSLAKKQKLRDCYFVDAGPFLDASSAMIY